MAIQGNRRMKSLAGRNMAITDLVEQSELRGRGNGFSRKKMKKDSCKWMKTWNSHLIKYYF